MRNHCKKLFIWSLTVCLIFTQMVFSGAAFAGTSQSKRLSGTDRYKTAAAISQKGWPSGSNYVVLARGDQFADALCAGPLAKKYNAPILLTQTDSLSDDTLTEIKRLGAKHVFIVGGTGAISQKAEDAIKSASISDVVRLYGNDRYETSAAVAEKIGATGKTAVLATGQDFPDALSISTVAASMGMPILLTEKDTLPDKVNQYIKNKGITQVYVIGGVGVISSGIEKAVPGAVRLGGNDRYDTNVKVMQNFINKLDLSKLYVAVGDGPSGDEFADALSGAALASTTASPIILAYQTLPQVTGNFIMTNISFATTVVSLGGDAVMPSSIVDSILAYKDTINVAQKYDKAGTYGPESGSNTVKGNVVISAADVTLQNTVIEGDLLLAESIGDGNVALKGVTVKGTTVVNGGGPHSVVMYDFNGKNVVVDVPDGSSVRLVAQGNTSVASVRMNSNGKLEESGLTRNGFSTVVIPEGVTVVLAGQFDAVDVKAAGASVNVESGSVTTLTVAPSAVNTDVTIAAGAKVTTIEANAPTDIKSEGTVGKIVNTNPANKVTDDGKEVPSTPTPTPTPTPTNGGDTPSYVDVSDLANNILDTTTKAYLKTLLARFSDVSVDYSNGSITATIGSGIGNKTVQDLYNYVKEYCSAADLYLNGPVNGQTWRDVLPDDVTVAEADAAYNLFIKAKSLNQYFNYDQLKAYGTDYLNKKGYTVNKSLLSYFISEAKTLGYDAAIAKIKPADDKFDNLPELVIKQSDKADVTLTTVAINGTQVYSNTTDVVNLQTIRTAFNTTDLSNLTLSSLKGKTFTFTFSSGEVLTLAINN